MATLQSTYLEDHANGAAGLIANFVTSDVDSRRVETDRIPFGVATRRGTAYDQVRLGISANAFAGISVIDSTLQPVQDDTYVEGDVASILWRGDVWVELQDAGGNDSATIGAIAYADPTTGQLTPVAPGRVNRVRITNGGSGYTSTTTVQFQNNGSTRAQGTVTVSAGAVTGVTLTNRGAGYTTPPSVTFADSGSSSETGATGVAEISRGIRIPGAVFQRAAAGGELTIVRLVGQMR